MSCLECEDRGIVWAYKKAATYWDTPTGAEVFRCLCTQGCGKPKSYAKWDAEAKRRYIPESKMTFPTSGERPLIQKEGAGGNQPDQLPSPAPLSSFQVDILDEAWVMKMFREKRTAEPAFLEALKKYGREKFEQLYRQYQKTSLSLQGNES